MKEFGSDFHEITDFQLEKSNAARFPLAYWLLADGRQCILALLMQYEWKRIWMPEYFCYNIIEYLQKNTCIDIVFYTDYPGNDDECTIPNLSFREGDVLFRMNYFGLRSFRSTKKVPVPVIEDHSHDLIGDWAKNSDADWCIASLRKIIPIPEGGVLWSPKGLKLDKHPVQTSFNEELTQKRWQAMEEKNRYLKGEEVDKETFRSIYIETEDAFDEFGLSPIDERSREFLERFDIDSWYDAKKRNWQILSNLSINDGVQMLGPEMDTLVPFSLVLLFDDNIRRDRIKRKLIESSIYPAVLWDVPDGVHQNVKALSTGMLSIHCDGRYDKIDITELYNRINSIIQND